MEEKQILEKVAEILSKLGQLKTRQKTAEDQSNG